MGGFRHSTNHLPAACQVKHEAFHTWDMPCVTHTLKCSVHITPILCVRDAEDRGGISHHVVISRTGKARTFTKKANWN